MPHLETFDLPLRVRYGETDQMGVVYHANYLTYFEMGRTEMLRAAGVSYRDLEQRGFLLVIVEVRCRYRKPAKYDDELIVRTHLKKTTGVRIQHTYQLLRGHELLVEGETTLACVDREGRLQGLPPELVAEE